MIEQDQGSRIHTHTRIHTYTYIHIHTYLVEFLRLILGLAGFVTPAAAADVVAPAVYNIWIMHVPERALLVHYGDWLVLRTGQMIERDQDFVMSHLVSNYTVHYTVT